MTIDLPRTEVNFGLLAEHVGPHAFALAAYRLLGLRYEDLEIYRSDGALLQRAFQEGLSRR